MIARTAVAAALLAATPALAAAPVAPQETSIPRISRFLEWRPDGDQALFIRAESGRWYRATLDGPCPRIQDRSGMTFIGSPGNQLDRFSQISVQGWRCQIAGVTRSEGPPRRRR